MYRIILFLAIGIVLAASTLNAQEYGGQEIINGIKTKESDIYAHSINTMGAAHLAWNVKTLMGEPVVSAKGIVIIPDQSSYEVTFKDRSYKVPGKIFKKIKAVSLKIKAQVSPDKFMDFDLGAMGNVYFGSPVLLAGLTFAEKKSYLSFNIPGSPQWDKLFYSSRLGLGQTPAYLTQDRAKNFFSSGIKIYPLGSYAEAVFNMNPVKEWIKNQDGQKSDQKASPKKNLENGKTKGDSKNKDTGKNKKAFNAHDPFIEDNPFSQFEKMESETSPGKLKKIQGDIRAFILKRCGRYYTSVKQGKGSFHLTAEYIGETKEERKRREKKAKSYARKEEKRISRAKREAKDQLPELQRQWKAKRSTIKPECRAYIIKKYGLTHSVKALEQLLDENFTTIDPFKAVYYVY